MNNINEIIARPTDLINERYQLSEKCVDAKCISISTIIPFGKI